MEECEKKGKISRESMTTGVSTPSSSSTKDRIPIFESKPVNNVNTNNSIILPNLLVKSSNPPIDKAILDKMASVPKKSTTSPVENKKKNDKCSIY